MLRDTAEVLGDLAGWGKDGGMQVARETYYGNNKDMFASLLDALSEDGSYDYVAQNMNISDQLGEIIFEDIYKAETNLNKFVNSLYEKREKLMEAAK